MASEERTRCYAHKVYLLNEEPKSVRMIEIDKFV